MTGPNKKWKITLDPIQALRDGLKMWVVEGEIQFDRPTPLRRMATATLRGLGGTCLLEESPEVFALAFKPSAGGNTPPAYLFQSCVDRFIISESFPFRLVTWDSDHKLMDHLMRALSNATGKSFGDSGSIVKSCSWSIPSRKRFSGFTLKNPEVSLYLKTPLQIRYQKKILPSEQLTLGHLVIAAQKRINLLSNEYGNGLEIPLGPFLEEAILAREKRRSLREVLPMRRSCTQSNTISLRGITGRLNFTGLSPMVADLLSVAETLHLGRHTAEGCGLLLLKSMKTNQTGL